MRRDSELFEPVEHVTVWLDQDSIMIKTREPHGDPVEMSEHEADALIEQLRALVALARQ